MNPMPNIEIVQLYGRSIHAGGWPKLGWQSQDDADDAMTCYDDIILL